MSLEPLKFGVFWTTCVAAAVGNLGVKEDAVVVIVQRGYASVSLALALPLPLPLHYSRVLYLGL